MNPPARRLSIWFHDPQPSGPVRIHHTLARLSRPAEAVVKPRPQRAHPPPAAIAAGAETRPPVAPHYGPGKRSRTNAKAQRRRDARTSAAGHHHLLGESFRPVFPLPSPCSLRLCVLASLHCYIPICSQAAKDLTQRRRGRGGTLRKEKEKALPLCVAPRPLRLCVKADLTSAAALPRCVNCPS
jgi:hypothetical protein